MLAAIARPSAVSGEGEPTLAGIGSGCGAGGVGGEGGPSQIWAWLSLPGSSGPAGRGGCVGTDFCRAGLGGVILGQVVGEGGRGLRQGGGKAA